MRYTVVKGDGIYDYSMALPVSALPPRPALVRMLWRRLMSRGILDTSGTVDVRDGRIVLFQRYSQPDDERFITLYQQVLDVAREVNEQWEDFCDLTDALKEGE